MHILDQSSFSRITRVVWFTRFHNFGLFADGNEILPKDGNRLYCGCVDEWRAIRALVEAATGSEFVREREHSPQVLIRKPV